ncbi:M48 family metalloprotease [Tolumonas osonensis]|uniref:Putative beta-barrel assembly-enhancing protease n=1 Tax=Tolumonas osonensis TaxID=675874 RepID=A0A841GRL7_9GAMM|nr:putative Zn-dependent protease [Tolumonas osonensis]
MLYCYLKKSLLCLGTACYLAFSSVAQADSQLPDIGTAGVSALSVEQEILYGKAFMRFARGSLPIIDDPVLDEYISDLGLKMVSQANDVRFPFTFFLVKDDSINAAAFLGGRIKVHSGLFLHAETESELAGVLAHEISHVTQRHIARYMEDQAKSTPLSVAGLIGSIALAMLNPTAGAAAINTTMGLTMQNSINFTRDNEYEADRIGIALLANSGFEPGGMMTFFQKLAAENRYSSKLPEMLLTHPITEKRIAEARNRADSYRTPYRDSSLDFYLAKARIQAMYTRQSPDSLQAYFEQNIKKNHPDSSAWLAAQYGKALTLMKLNRTTEAGDTLKMLAKKLPDNLFFQDSLTDQEIDVQQYNEAISRLEQRSRNMPDNPVIIMNLANVYLKANQADASIRLLDQYTRNNPESSVAWQLLAEGYQQTANQAGFHQAQAEYLALRGNIDQATDQLHMARANTADSLSQARIDARIAELEEQKKVDDSLKR